MLFVPVHGALHVDLCKAKDDLGYLNKSPKINAKYKETHLKEFRSPLDLDVGKKWVDLFLQHSCFYRCIVIDWSIYDGSYFGDPFDPAALKKRRAYKKWAELLLQPELSDPTLGSRITNASLYLDKLRIMYGYDVVSHLKDRFQGDYAGSNPYISLFQHTNSAADANQCLQLCDLLTGCLYQQLVPSSRERKKEMKLYLESKLTAVGIKNMSPSFWKQYHPISLRRHLPKFSAWFWQPTGEGAKRRKRW